MTTEIKIPHGGWLPRAHQMALWRYLHEGGKRALAVWHRRAGKDEIALHHAAVSMARRPGNYAHFLPEFTQGRRSIWAAVNPHTGRRRIDEAFPHELRANTNDHEMFIRFKNGSTWSVLGSDRYDSSIVGSSLAGVVFSEYALSNPSAWGYCRPMVEENDGWALFISTPRGRNHAYDLYKYAKQQPAWFCELQSALDTKALTQQQLTEALAEYVALYGFDVGHAQYAQELLCDWQAAVLGSYLGYELMELRKEGRVLEVEALPDRPVNRSWDLGIGDSTVLWFYQIQGAQVVILDCYEANSKGAEHFAEVIAQRNAKYGWRDGTDYVPHDAAVREWGTGRSRLEVMRQLGLNPIRVQQVSLEDGLQAMRRTLPLCVFHPRCEGGLAALEQYKREWDDELKVFKDKPLHDWTSDYADSFRYLSLSWRPAAPRKVKPRLNGWTIPPPPEPRAGMRL